MGMGPRPPHRRPAHQRNVGQGFPIDLTIEVSEDAVTWTTVLSHAGYPLPNAAGQTFAFTGHHARYVRVTGTHLLHTNPNDRTYRRQLAEVEVY